MQIRVYLSYENCRKFPTIGIRAFFENSWFSIKIWNNPLLVSFVAMDICQFGSLLYITTIFSWWLLPNYESKIYDWIHARRMWITNHTSTKVLRLISRGTND